MSHCGIVDTPPWPGPGVVAQHARLSVSLFFDSCRREHEFLEVSDHVVGQHRPELVLDELSHLFAQERGVQSGRRVAAFSQAFVFLFACPRLRAGADGHSLVPPLS